MQVGPGGRIRSNAAGFTTGTRLVESVQRRLAAVPRRRSGRQPPRVGRLRLVVRTGKLLIDSNDNAGPIGIGVAPNLNATLNLTSDDDTTNSWSLQATNHSGSIVSLIAYGDGSLFVGPLHILPGAWDATGFGSNPGMQANGPFGLRRPTGWMRVDMWTGSAYQTKWIPAY